MYATGVKLANRLQAMIEGEKRENKHLREAAALEGTPQRHGEMSVGAQYTPQLLPISNEGLDIVNGSDLELRRNIELGRQVHELKEKIWDLEAVDIGREMELAAGRHREGNLR